jgi:catechol 2,3-dioxygenase-like lactoylglutathione lyase family enzyme
MIGYVTLGTNDFERARAFYDALLEQVGAKRLASSDSFAYWGKRRVGMLALTRPYDRQPATAGNGTMVAIGVRDRGTVERAHARGLELGGRDEGRRGLAERDFSARICGTSMGTSCAFSRTRTTGRRLRRRRHRPRPPLLAWRPS